MMSFELFGLLVLFVASELILFNILVLFASEVEEEVDVVSLEVGEVS